MDGFGGSKNRRITMASNTGSDGNRRPPLCGGRRRVVATKKRGWTNPLAVNNSVKKLQRREICSKPHRSSSITKSLHRFCNFRLTGAGGPDEEDNKWPPWLKPLLCESFFGAGGPDEEDNKWPPWLKPLLCESFFVQCKLHEDSHKLIFGRIRCGHCKKLAPIFDLLGTSVKKTKYVFVGKPLTPGYGFRLSHLGQFCLLRYTSKLRNSWCAQLSICHLRGKGLALLAMDATKGLMDHLFMAACEWFLMFWVFIDATLASSLTKFAQYCELQIPCLLCSRFDHFFGNEEPGTNLNLFCNKHQVDISYLIYCDLHNKLVDVREMCEDCLRSVTLQSQSNLEPFRFMVGAIGREKEGYRRSNKNFVCVSSGIRTCSCCKGQWKAKSSGRAMVQPNVVGSGVAKATTKPPLPRVSRRNRSRRPDSFKKMRNKIKHRRVDPMLPVGFPQFKFTSDSEFEFLFSDDDDGSFKAVGIGEGNLKDDSIMGGSKNDEIQSGIRRRAYSTSDLGSALLEAQLNESRRIRSASLTPNCSIGHGLTELYKKPNIMHFPHGKTEEFDLSRARRDKKLLSSDRHGSLDGSQDPYKIFTRHSFNASDLRSALLLEMLLGNNILPRRSASLTPSSSYGHGLGEANFPKSQSRPTPKVKRYKKSRNPTNGQGSLDDSAVSRRTGSHSHNQNHIPRRHSCSVFHMGCGKILLNMPVDESLMSYSASLAPNGSISRGLEEPKKSKFQKGGKENNPLPPTGSTKRFGSSSDVRSYLDDSVVSTRTGGQYQNTIPRRHSYSAFDSGGAVLVEMHIGQSSRNRSASLTPNASVGYGFGEPKRSKNQIRPSPSHPQELGHHTHGKTKRDKKPLPSMNSINRLSSPPNVRSEFLATSLDDSVISRNANNRYTNVNPRRHSYSAFELGCALLLNMNLDESLRRHSASLAPNGSIDRGLVEPNMSKSQKDNPLPPHSSNKRLSSSSGVKSDSSTTFSDKTKRRGSLDDSVVSRRTGSQNQNETPRRHSISAFDLGRALLVEMHLDESLKNPSSSLHSSEPNSLQSHHRKAKKDKNPLPLPPNSISLDDSFVSKNSGSHNHHTNPRRHSYSVLELGCAILLNMKTDESPNYSASLDPNGSIGHGSTLQKGAEDKKSLPPISSVKGFSSSPDVRSDLSTDKTKRHGSLDDSVVSRSTGSQNQNETPRRHSISAFDLGRALLVEMYLDESLKRCYASSVPSCSAGIVSSELNRSKHQNQPSSHSSEYSSANGVQFPHQKAKSDKVALPPPNTINKLGSSSDVRSDQLTISFKKTNGYGSLDDSVVVSRSPSDHNQYNSPRRHSYSTYEMGLTPNCSMGHNLEKSKKSKTETRPSSLNAHQKAEGSRHKRSRKDVGSSVDVRNDLSSASLYKPDGNVSFDDSFVSYNRDNQNRHTNLPRNSYSTSDLRSLHLQQMNLDESLTSKSASLKPNCSIGQGSGELNWLTFQTGTNSCSLEFGYLNSTQLSHRKRKKHGYPKAKKAKKSLPSTNYVKLVSSSTNADSDLDKADGYVSFDDVVSNNNDRQNRYNIFSRNSQSATDLSSAYLLEMHLEDSLRRRSASVTPDCATEYGLEESKWPKSPNGPSRYHSPELGSPNHEQFPVEEAKKADLQEFEKDKKPPLPSMHPTKEMDFSTNTRSDLCTACLDKIDGRSMDGRSVCESEIDAGADKQKLQAEDDLRCMRLLQSELEAERNAATVAAHHAMNMITRLQQEKAALQMEALQYLRMMEEQAEYDMEALQKANELVEEKENEIQDLVDELEQYRRKYGDESTRHVHAPIKSLEEEKKYVLQWLSTLEQQLHQISSLQTSNGMSNGDIKSNENSLSTQKDSSISKGVNDKSQENKIHVDSAQKMVSKDGEVDLATIQHEIAYLKEKMETFEADLEFLRHTCNTLHSDEGLEFIQDITLQLQDLRSFMFDRKYSSSS
ncbi:hypothetical protein L6452_38149 [Arctium lappa]|uniref:Uncharacterized protein n=1 Tax=Arctium lappa TaxID=4217 RepID=A0ACB8Y5I2_ARCLA|nr:hypothetical protein L6452_38149 [Arctium lappa]